MGIYLVGVLLAIVAFVGVSKLTSSVSDKNTVGERLKKMTPAGGGANDSNEDDFDEIAPSADLLEKMMRPVGINVEEKYEDSNIRLTQAGVTSTSSVIYYTFAKSLGWLVGFGFAALLILSSQADGKLKLAVYGVAVLLVLMGIFGADLWVSNKKKKRQLVLQRSFPDALDLLLICVESGLALDAALARTCRELGVPHPLITEELNKTRLDLTLLGDREKALQNLALRTDMVPFRALVASLIQTEKFGTNLADTLRVLSDDYRNTRLMIAENKAGRLPALMAIPMMLLMLPALILIIVSPAILMLFDTK